MDDVDLERARARIRERSDLNAFISVSEEQGAGDAVGVRDLIDVGGMVTRAGGVILPDVPASEDAPVIKRLRQSGCAIVGKANLHEFAYGVTSINPHYGTVRNPHDTRRVAGGSSGGSAVAVAAGMWGWAGGRGPGGFLPIPPPPSGRGAGRPAFAGMSLPPAVSPSA